MANNFSSNASHMTPNRAFRSGTHGHSGMSAFGTKRTFQSRVRAQRPFALPDRGSMFHLSKKSRLTMPPLWASSFTFYGGFSSEL